MPLTHARSHAWRIDDRECARYEQRRGRRHAYEVLDPARTALVVVDLVEFFARKNPYAAGTVPVANRLAGAVRSAGGTVVWVTPADVDPTPTRIEFSDLRSLPCTGGPATTRGAISTSSRVTPPWRRLRGARSSRVPARSTTR